MKFALYMTGIGSYTGVHSELKYHILNGYFIFIIVIFVTAASVMRR